MIHPTAIISDKAQISDGVEIGPYCVIGDGVSIDTGCRLHSHVVIEKNTLVGKDCEFFPFAAIGGRTQDLKYDGEPTALVIGERNIFRENVTVHRSTSKEQPTTVGSDNNFLAYAHVAHDCQLGSHIIFSNNATIAGHVIVEDYAIISGLSAVHQFCRIGKHSIIGGCAKIVQDVTSYMIVDGAPASVRGVNLTGLQRRGFTDEQIREVKNVYKKVFRKSKKEENLNELIADLAPKTELEKEICDFIHGSERGIIR